MSHMGSWVGVRQVCPREPLRQRSQVLRLRLDVLASMLLGSRANGVYHEAIHAPFWGRSSLDCRICCDRR